MAQNMSRDHEKSKISREKSLKRSPTFRIIDPVLVAAREERHWGPVGGQGEEFFL